MWWGAKGDEMDEIDEKDEALVDLDTVASNLYVYARRFVRAYKRLEIDGNTPSDRDLSVSEAAELLHEVSHEYIETYARAEEAGAFEDDA
jgi:hypothetical protein